jgi:hypothetical protein
MLRALGQSTDHLSATAGSKLKKSAAGPRAISARLAVQLSPILFRRDDFKEVERAATVVINALQHFLSSASWLPCPKLSIAEKKQKALYIDPFTSGCLLCGQTFRDWLKLTRYTEQIYSKTFSRAIPCLACPPSTFEDIASLSKWSNYTETVYGRRYALHFSTAAQLKDPCLLCKEPVAVASGYGAMVKHIQWHTQQDAFKGPFKCPECVR